MDLSNNVISESVKKRKEKMISKSEWFGGNLKSKTVNYLNNVKFFLKNSIRGHLFIKSTRNLDPRKKTNCIQ